MRTYESTSRVFPLQNTSRKNRAWSEISRSATWSLSCTANPAHVTPTVGGSRCSPKGPWLLEPHPKLCSAAAAAGLSPRIYLQKIKLLAKTLCGIFGILEREDNEQASEWTVVLWRQPCTPKTRSEPNKLTLAQLQTKMFFTLERDTQRQKMQHIRVKRARRMKSIRTTWDGNQTGCTVSTNTKESTQNQQCIKANAKAIHKECVINQS